MRDVLKRAIGPVRFSPPPPQEDRDEPTNDENDQD
jgi:hypothetical protein